MIARTKTEKYAKQESPFKSYLRRYNELFSLQ